MPRTKRPYSIRPDVVNFDKACAFLGQKTPKQMFDYLLERLIHEKGLFELSVDEIKAKAAVSKKVADNVSDAAVAEPNDIVSLPVWQPKHKAAIKE